MSREYLNLKRQYEDYIIIVKKGLFYRTFNNDCYIINYIANYKINIFNEYLTLCFPKESLNKIKGRLDRLNINYLIVIDTASIKKDNINNAYYSYLKETEEIKNKLITKINKLNLDTIN